MDYFSWMLADINNKRNLTRGSRGYLACPDGTFVEEPCYDGYGHFSGVDVYDKVVAWNRQYLADHPEHWLPYRKCQVQEFWWYPIVANLTIPFSELPYALAKRAEELSKKEKRHQKVWFPEEIRSIGIDIAGYDEDNAALPYPIKITRGHAMPYDDLPPSKSDATQGNDAIKSQQCIEKTLGFHNSYKQRRF